MEKKNCLDIQNKAENKKDRGDQLKRVVKPKAVPKKDVESTKEFITDRGDSVLKIVREKLNLINTKHHEMLRCKTNEKKSKDLVTDRGVSVPKLNQNQNLPKYILKNIKRNEAISKSIDKSVPTNTKQNESKSFDKSVTNNNKKNATKSLDKSTPTYNKQNEPKGSDKSASLNFFTDTGVSVLKPLDTKAMKSKNLEKLGPFESVTKNTKHNEVLSRRSDKLPSIGLVTNKVYSKTVKDKIIKSTNHDEEKNLDKSNNSVCVVKKNIVENEKHVTRLLDIDEKKRIREKYTYKPKANVKNKKLDVLSNSQDSRVEDNNDILDKLYNVADSNEKWNENAKSDSTKIDRISNSTEKSRKRPIIKTVVAKNDATKVYKAVSFAKQKQKLNTPLKIKIPVLMKQININIPNDALAENMKLPTLLQTSEDSLLGNMKNLSISQNNDDNLVTNLKKPKILPNAESLMKNTKPPKIFDSDNHNLTRNPIMPIDAFLGTSKIQKLKQSNVMNLRKISVSRTSVKTKISEKEIKRKRLKSKLSRVSLSKESTSPATEVAKWAPNCIDKHTKPYYEAWVNTTLAAISKNTKKDKLYYENHKLIKKLKNLMEKGSESSELVHENYLDARYTGKIKINHRQ